MKGKIMRTIIFKLFFISVFALASFATFAANSKLDHEITSLMNDYLAKHKNDELVTGVAVSIGYPGKNHSDNIIADYYAGRVSNAKNAGAINKNNLFQIGSITKSFTSIIILDLEKQGVLNINQTIGDWLPQYPKWKDIKIKQLLNMTSTIPGYVTVPELALNINNNIHRQWSDKEIVEYVYKFPHSTKGFDYSDTNYRILAMIIEKATNESFEKELQKRLLKAYKLKDTFYFVKPYPDSILNRLPKSYYYGQTSGNLKNGEEVTSANMSMAGAAGAIVSTTHELATWVKLLFSGELLSPAQQKELLQLVWMKNGEPIEKTSKDATGGFGLGIVEAYGADIGRFWIYEGDTTGFRAIYMMSQCNKVIVALALNSSAFVDPDVKDHAKDLLFDIYKAVLKNDDKYRCTA